MAGFFRKTLGGLSQAYLIRQYIFGIIIGGPLIWLMLASQNPHKVANVTAFIIFTLLYPYSRFVYESCIEYITGRNVFAFPVGIFLFVKMMTMLMCWALAIFIAPLGLLFLYFYHSRAEKSAG